MTKRQLRAFFEKFNLPEDYSEQSLSELKKIILLELKSSADDLLVVDSRNWTRNDVLEFFDGKLEDGFDEVSFYETFPWAKAIIDPKRINYSPALERMRFDHEEFIAFRNQEAIHYEKAYLDELRSDMRERRDLPVAGMLCYLGCFRTEFQFTVLNTMRSMMNSRLNDAMAAIESSSSKNKIANISFMQSPGYYVVLKKIGDDDGDLLIDNLRVFGSGIAGGNVDTVIDIIRKQKTLPHSPEGFQFLDEVHREVLAIKIGNEKSERSGEWGGVGTILSIIIAVLVALFKCSRMASRNDREPAIDWQQFEKRHDLNVPRVIIDQDTAYIIQYGDTSKRPLKGNPSQLTDSIFPSEGY
jgi:hypothetical protein